MLPNSYQRLVLNCSSRFVGYLGCRLGIGEVTPAVAIAVCRRILIGWEIWIAVAATVIAIGHDGVMTKLIVC